MNAEIQSAAKAGPPRWLRSFGARLALLLVVFLAFDALLEPLNNKAAGFWLTGLIVGPIVAVVTLIAYRKLVGWLEERPVDEVNFRTAKGTLLRGTALGIGLFTITLLLILMCNSYRLHGGSFGGMLANLGLMAGAATLEEVLFRGVVYRMVEQKFGTLVALIVSSVLFGGLHLINPHATIWGALAIAIEAGLMLGSAYAATRSLWLPIALHLGWNFAESGIFGATVSGSNGTAPGLFTGLPHGPAIISGGGFGPEASIFAILVCGTAGFFLIRKARKSGNWK